MTTQGSPDALPDLYRAERLVAVNTLDGQLPGDGTAVPAEARTSSPSALPPALAAVPELAEAVAMVEKLHAQHAELQNNITITEDRFIAMVAQAHHQGQIDWKGLVIAYDLVRSWSKVNGLGSFVNRWECHVQHDRNSLSRFAKSMPTGPDGTWSGSTGWDGLDTEVCPQRGMHVAFVLFGNGNVPVHIGFTQQFRNRLKTLDREGLAWTSWFAQLCDARDDAVEVRRELVRRYGEPNIDAQPSAKQPALPPARSSRGLNEGLERDQQHD